MIKVWSMNCRVYFSEYEYGSHLFLKMQWWVGCLLDGLLHVLTKLHVDQLRWDLTHDDQDSVRLLAVEGCAGLGKLLEPHDSRAHILPVIVAQDKSWRVRYNVANQLSELCEAVGPENTRTELLPAYVKLLRDLLHQIWENLLQQLSHNIWRQTSCHGFFSEFVDLSPRHDR